MDHHNFFPLKPSFHSPPISTWSPSASFAGESADSDKPLDLRVKQTRSEHAKGESSGVGVPTPQDLSASSSSHHLPIPSASGWETTAKSVEDVETGGGQSRERPLQPQKQSRERSKVPVICYSPTPPGSLEALHKMLKASDARLEYINDGEAVVNPFAVDRKTQVADLTMMLCKEVDGGFECKACGRRRRGLRGMRQHLLCHSDSKFFICVRCLKGFNDTFDMKRHTRKHTMVRPYECSQCRRRFTQRCSLESHMRRVHSTRFHFRPHQRREAFRVCEYCGFVCDSYADLQTHTESKHPSRVYTLVQLRRRLAAGQGRSSSAAQCPSN